MMIPQQHRRIDYCLRTGRFRRSKCLTRHEPACHSVVRTPAASTASHSARGCWEAPAFHHRRGLSCPKTFLRCALHITGIWTTSLYNEIGGPYARRATSMHIVKLGAVVASLTLLTLLPGCSAGVERLVRGEAKQPPPHM